MRPACGRRSGHPLRLRVVVTAGPTWELLDAVRVVTNPSTGTMGYAVAAAARDRGHGVTLITGPTSLTPPAGLRVQRVITTREMARALRAALRGADVLFMASAVADFRSARRFPGKWPRSLGARRITLVPTQDILASLAPRKGRAVWVGWALERAQALPRAAAKLLAKRLDLIVANEWRANGHPFGRRAVDATLVDAMGRIERVRHMSKRRLADRVVRRAEALVQRSQRREKRR